MPWEVGSKIADFCIQWERFYRFSSLLPKHRLSIHLDDKVHHFFIANILSQNFLRLS
jgi:hypothetical protein